MCAAPAVRWVGGALLATCLGAAILAAPLRAQDVDSGATLVSAARGYDRANQFDSARIDYLAAADKLAGIADWLRLRAAGVTADSAARAEDYRTIHNPVAAARIPWTEAEARERSGDLLGAAQAYATLGARIDALRDSATAISASGDSVARAAVRTSLLALITSRPGAPDARSAADVADHLFTPLSPPEELAIARSAAAGGPLARAVTGFDRVAATIGLDSLTPRDLFSYASGLARLHRDGEAVRIFGLLTARPESTVTASLAHAAEYQRARALVAAGDRPGARAALHALVRDAPHDTAAANAGMLLADLSTDDGDETGARRQFLEVARRFPSIPLAARARFRAALLAFVGGSAVQAAREWDTLVVRFPRAEDSTAARYWSGRAWASAGRRRLAVERWRAVLARDPLSYYAVLSARRLSVSSPIGSLHLDTLTTALPAAVDTAIGQAAQLAALGMAVEAKFEVDRALHDAGESTATLAAAGAALVRAGEASRAVTLGWHLVARTDTAWRDVRVLRLIYPLAYGDTLAREARAKGLEPALVAAIVRQESAFNPHAVSVVGARGLMQIMPNVGRGLAESRRLNSADPDLLDQPDVNLAFGIAHLATFFTQEGGNVVRTLAAYNAGPARVAAWSTKRGVDDAEVFVERIPYTETRDYVRSILRGREMYAKLYGL